MVRLQAEEKKYFSQYVEFSKQKEQVLQKHREKLEWEKYSKCQTPFDTSKMSDLNLFITLLKETEVETKQDIQTLLDKIEQAQDIITNLKEQILELKSLRQKDFVNLE